METTDEKEKIEESECKRSFIVIAPRQRKEYHLELITHSSPPNSTRNFSLVHYAQVTRSFRDRSRGKGETLVPLAFSANPYPSSHKNHSS